MKREDNLAFSWRIRFEKVFVFLFIGSVFVFYVQAVASPGNLFVFQEEKYLPTCGGYSNNVTNSLNILIDFLYK